jgi:3-hydroxybutyryl-CoA dehydrogenase
MNILVIGDKSDAQECQDKFGKDHQYTVVANQREAKKFFGASDIVFDFSIDEDSSQIEVYCDPLKMSVFLNTSKTNLAQLTQGINRPITSTLFGFCGMPTFLNRELLEVSIQSRTDSVELQRICEKLNTGFIVVDDRVGLVTPRVICMIINEAFYTVGEGTATREDIDIAMKLGTNYPYGPFEWCKKIGIRHVYELLNSMYENTMDERYAICSLLKKEYLEAISRIKPLSG